MAYHLSPFQNLPTSQTCNNTNCIEIYFFVLLASRWLMLERFENILSVVR
jgi:hypothetical protein